ncbi:hypothetical protein [Microbulbifer hydrolyticus]|uniref:Uncharacterized protein n=1 Tax=Microbulbifer hydrolyticus TaxID=48074 RepID=A0A6P1TDH1_9GAMM|nr:hypothetical protein [Microbulbifer hydrolyticus]MBB5209857.1 hypothetical protein [Microbulbifer hydrolyticus]QHQ39600.1 hypothetical protein GTQ55_11805 [Microbulbifer hydrolyticus]
MWENYLLFLRELLSYLGIKKLSVESPPTKDRIIYKVLAGEGACDTDICL